MIKRRVYLAVLGLSFVPIVAFTFGGWAVITVDDLPDYAVAGRPMQLSYMVRQHGFTKLTGLHGNVEVQRTGGNSVTRVDAQPKWKDGQYVGAVTFPTAGEYVVTIRSGFGNSDITLLPLTVVAPNTAAPRAIGDTERGRQLFVAKGCVTCHVHDQVPGSGRVAVGPELSKLRFPAEYLAQFLADPSIKPSANGRMPKLDLGQRDIASLSAFINSEKRLSSK